VNICSASVDGKDAVVVGGAPEAAALATPLKKIAAAKGAMLLI
jgi:hypothetical protein